MTLRVRRYFALGWKNITLATAARFNESSPSTSLTGCLMPKMDPAETTERSVTCHRREEMQPRPVVHCGQSAVRRPHRPQR